MIRRPPISTRTDTLFPYTTLFRSLIRAAIAHRVFVLLAALTLALMGMFSVTRTPVDALPDLSDRSEEHTSELQSLMRISYAVFCLKKTNTTTIPQLYISQKTRTYRQLSHNK